MLLASLIGAEVAHGQAASLDAGQFQRDLEALARYSHRLSGVGSEHRVPEMARRVEQVYRRFGADQEASEIFRDATETVLEYLDDPTKIADGPGSLTASKYIQMRLQAISKRLADEDDLEVFAQEFDVAQPRTTECKMTVDGQTVEMLATRPNVLVASVTPAEGLTGPIVYAGKGELVDYGKRDINGAIVLLEHDGDWKTPFAFGARAVVLIGDPTSNKSLSYQVQIPANLPLFFLPAETAGSLDLRRSDEAGPLEATIVAACTWERLRGRSIIARLRGTNAGMGVPGGDDQAIVLTAPIDSLSEVPELSPGARDAANAAALLQLTDYFATHRPKRDVIVCFLDGQTLCHLGARAFYGAIRRPLDETGERPKNAVGDPISKRSEMIQSEYEFLEYAKQLLTQENVFEPDTADLEAQRKDVQRRMKRPFLMGIGPGFTVWGFTVLAALLCSAAVLMFALIGRTDSVSLLATRRMVVLLAVVAAAAWCYGNFVDPPLFDEAREELAQKNRYERTLLDRLTKRIDGLESSHRAMTDLLRDRARLNNSDILDDLRDLRIEVTAVHDALKDRDDYKAVHEPLEELWTQLVELAKQIKRAERRGKAEDLARLQGELTKVKRQLPLATDAYLAVAGELEAIRDRLDELLVIDLLWNACQRIIRREGKFDPTANDSEKLDTALKETIKLTEALQDKDPGRQRAKRRKLIEKLTGRTFNEATGEWDLDPAVTDHRFQGTFGQLKQEIMADCRERQLELLARAADIERAKQLHEVMGVGKSEVALHVSLNLSDTRKQWSFSHGDTTTFVQKDTEDTYQKTFDIVRDIADRLGPAVEDFNRRAISGDYRMALFAGPGVDSTGIARLVAIKNLSIMTAMDPLTRQGQVTDTLERLDAPVLFEQARQAGVMLKALADDEKLKPHANFDARAAFHDIKWENQRNSGIKISRVSSAHAMRQHAVPGALVATYNRFGWITAAPVPGFVHTINLMTDSRGFIEYGPVHPYYWVEWKRRLAASFDDRGIVRYVANQTTIESDQVTVFKTRSMTLCNYGFAGAGASAMDGLGTANFPPAKSFYPAIGHIQTVYAPYDALGMKLFNSGSFVILNNEPTSDGHAGVGISMDDEFAHPVVIALTARDLGVLNEYRLDLLRNSKINQESLQFLNGLAKDLLADTEAAGIEGLGLQAYAGNMATSAAMSRRTYPPLLTVMNDLVTAVVLLLLLAMPFAYALERLIIGTPHIYRQIGWFAVFFIGTFAVLYVVNPAFRIASTPIIIFLAFTIMLLSSLVITLLVRKLQTEVKAMQGLGQTVHSTDVSRISTMSAAVMMGISTMRRRPLRTFLTAATVVLLTFTILTFASFGTRFDTRVNHKGSQPTLPARAFLHDSFWNQIDAGVLQVLRGHMVDEAEIVPRYWISPTAGTAKSAAESGIPADKLLADDAAVATISVGAAIGLDPVDVARQPALKNLFEPGARLDLLSENGIFLPSALADSLDLTPDDIGKTTVLLSGRQFVFAGVVSDRLASFKSLDESSIVPVDFEVATGSEGLSAKQTTGGGVLDQELREPPEIDAAQFTVFGVGRVAVVGAEMAKEVEGSIRALTVYPTDPARTEDVARRVATITRLPTYFGAEGNVYRTVFAAITSATGAWSLAIPVVLGGLIIFATMLGSVTDREREIYTFSSLGLAPAHVASLFFAEASVYAIVGGMGGYLLGQIVTRVLGWVATFTNIAVPEMNYSSTNAIVTILVVMGTVMISTIYPAIKASRSANPGIQRAWRIPSPVAGLYDLIFPFTVSAYDITGVVSFLKEHFDNYSDTSLGIMATSEVHIFRQEGGERIGITAAMALAPFDLGVNQRFALLSRPSEIEGIDEVHILIHRRTGTNGDWRRANRVFINDLRRQLLIWRSLTTKVVEDYRRRTLDAWADLPTQRIDETTIGEMP
jgi:hypothetical protein